jgi:hypothetical protein
MTLKINVVGSEVVRVGTCCSTRVRCTAPSAEPDSAGGSSRHAKDGGQCLSKIFNNGFKIALSVGDYI